MDHAERSRVVRRNRYCLNCLARTHSVRNCSSSDTCNKCGALQHSLLHPDRQVRGNTQPRFRGDRATSYHQGSKVVEKPLSAQNGGLNQQVIFEAIRSLAHILCHNPNTNDVAQVQGGRHG